MARSDGPTVNDHAYWLLYAAGQNGLTADEAAALYQTGGAPKINSIAPSFTHFTQLGIAAKVGRRATRNGSNARVLALAPGAAAIFAAAYGRSPMSTDDNA
jgi:hypothetical protein